MNDLVEQTLIWFRDNILSSQSAEFLAGVGHAVCERLKSDSAWRKQVSEIGKFFTEYENSGDPFSIDLSVILSEQNVQQLATLIKEDPGYSISEKTLSFLTGLFETYEVPRDMSKAYANKILYTLLEEIQKQYPEKYDRDFQKRWRDQEDEKLQSILSRLDEMSRQLALFKDQNIEVYTAEQKDTELKRRSFNPRIGISFFTIDDEDFRSTFFENRYNECIYVHAQCREEAIYSIINELWRIGDDRDILIVQRPEDWKKIIRMPSGNRIYIPWFYSDEIEPIPDNTTIFVLPKELPFFGKNAILLRPRTFASITHSLYAAGMEINEANALVAETHGLFIPMKRKIFKGVYLKEPAWLKALPQKIIKTCLLVGQWTGCEGDKLVIEELSGTPFEDFMSQVLQYSRNEDPLIHVVHSHHGNVYCLASAENTWDWIPVSFNETIWQDFEKMFLEVIVEAENLLICSWEDRLLARQKGENLFWSNSIRTGMIRSLIMKAYYKNDEACQQYMDRLVERILDHVNTNDHWKYISSLFNDLCEISPQAVLNRLNREFENPTGLWELFENQSNDFILGKHEYINILQGVCSILSIKEYAADGIEWLLRLDDRNYNYTANSPKDVLRKVFCPWHNFSVLSTPDEKITIAKRAFTIDRNAWDRIYEALPLDRHNMIIGGITHPKYRQYQGDTLTTNADMQRAKEGYYTILLRNMNGDPDRWIKLLKAADEIPAKQQEEAFNELLKQISHMNDTDVIHIKDSIREIIYNHRYFASSDWTMSEEQLEPFERILMRIIPSEPEYDYKYLFAGKRSGILLQPFPYGSEGHKVKNRQEEEQLIKEKMLTFKKEGLDLEKLARICGQENRNRLGMYLGAYWPDRSYDPMIFKVLLKAQPSGNMAIDYYREVSTREKVSFAQVLQTIEELHCDDEIKARLYREEALGSEGIPAIAQETVQLKQVFWKQSLRVKPEYVHWALNECAKYGDCGIYLDELYMAAHVCRFDCETLFRYFIKIEDLLKRNIQTCDHYQLTELLKQLQEAYMYDEERRLQLRNIELSFFGILQWEDMKCFQFEIKRNPALFAELVAVIFKKEGSIGKESNKDISPTVAEYCLTLYEKAHFCPGEQDGTVDSNILKAWVKELIFLLESNGQGQLVGMLLGRLFAFSPVGKDGHRPCEPVREMIEKYADESLLREYEMTVFNQRGVFNPSAGQEEKVMARGFERNADYLRIRYPRTAKIYDNLAERYRQFSQEEREDAENGN